MSGTNVKIVGFELNFSRNIGIGEFFQELERIDGKSTKLHNRTHYTFFDIKNDFIVGLVLTYTGDKKSIATHEDGESGDLMVNKLELLSDQNKTEVSLLCLNPGTRRGLFYQYPGNLSASGYFKILQRQHNQIKRRKIKDKANEFSQLSTSKDKAKAHSKACDYFSGEFSLKVLQSPSDIKKLIENYKYISSIEIHGQSALEKFPTFSPLAAIAKNNKVILNYDKRESIMTVMADRLSELISKLNLSDQEKSLALVGDLHSGEEKRLWLGENTDDYGRLKYDQFIDTLPTEKWKDYIESNALKNLITKIDKHHVAFGRPPSLPAWKILSAKDAAIETES